MSFISDELERDPAFYARPRCREMIDVQTLRHVLCNVDIPEGVGFIRFAAVMDAALKTLDQVPHWSVPEGVDLTCVKPS